MELNKGDIVLVNFNPTKGAEIGKYRPAIIVSATLDNQALPTLMVIPLSTHLVEHAEPYRVRIPARVGLKQDSDACINEVRALSKSRVQQHLSTVTAAELKTLTDCLCQLVKTD